jgi:hypothetical protein
MCYFLNLFLSFVIFNFLSFNFSKRAIPKKSTPYIDKLSKIWTPKKKSSKCWRTTPHPLRICTFLPDLRKNTIKIKGCRWPYYSEMTFLNTSQKFSSIGGGGGTLKAKQGVCNSNKVNPKKHTGFSDIQKSADFFLEL